MANQDKRTDAICWHGQWAVLQILRSKPLKWMNVDTLAKMAAARLPSSISEKVTQKPHWEIIKLWLWSVYDEGKGLGFITREEKIGKTARRIRLTSDGQQYLANHTWDDFEPLILGWNSERSIGYYFRHKDNDELREAGRLLIDELTGRIVPTYTNLFARLCPRIAEKHGPQAFLHVEASDGSGDIMVHDGAADREERVVFSFDTVEELLEHLQ